MHKVFYDDKIREAAKNIPRGGGGHSGPFQWVTLHVSEIKKIYQRIANNVNLSVLKLETRYLHQNGVEFN